MSEKERVRYYGHVYDHPRWRECRLAVFRRSGFGCELCGGLRRLEVHHIQPLSQGGAWFELANLQALCRGCHEGQHRKKPMGAERGQWEAFLNG